MSKYKIASKKTSDLLFPDVRPTLDLNFVENQKVPPFVNVTRNSQTTYVDKFGILRTADINQPVFEWDPITGKCLGARIWGVATNNLLQSENLSTTWTIFGATPNANIATAPNGTLTADKIEETATTGEHRASQVSAGGATTSVVTFSVFAKAAERTKIRLAFSSLASWSGGGGAAVIFDLIAGSASVDNSTPTAFGIQAYPNGWYRCWITGTPSVSLTPSANAFLFTTSGIYSGTAGSGAFLWGAQLNTGLLAPYVPTTTLAASSTADVWSITGADAARIINTAQGTLYADFATGSAIPANLFPSPIQLQGTNRQNEVQIYAVTGAVAYLIRTGSVVQAEANLSATTQNGVKSAFRYAENNSTSYVNGSPLFLDTVCTMPTTDRIFIGNNNGSENFLNGYIRRLTIYPKRLTDTQLQTLTR